MMLTNETPFQTKLGRAKLCHVFEMNKCIFWQDPILEKNLHIFEGDGYFRSHQVDGAIVAAISAWIGFYAK